jgi:hypothetical protein
LTVPARVAVLAVMLVAAPVVAVGIEPADDRVVNVISLPLLVPLLLDATIR